jgi:hypothetical protein
MNPSDWEELLKAKEQRREEKKELNKVKDDRWRVLNEMPWIKRIQEEEYKLYLEEFEGRQRWAFEKIVKRDYPSIKNDYMVYFAEYWRMLLAEEIKSIFNYLDNHIHEGA